jgi:SAM-dependent methyltransferase
MNDKADQYLAINRASWNKRIDSHYQSDFYDVASFLQGKTSLNSIEAALLPNLKGKKILHLQCHFGQDSLSLARLGAEVVGVDLSDEAIAKARELNDACALNARFICSDIYTINEKLDERFDLVFTSYGTIGWLPDLERWAQLISRYLKPKGQFIFAEFHPVVWMYDNDFKKVEYSYFKADPIIEKQQGTYAAKEEEIEVETVSWNHSLAEVLGSLLQAGLQLETFQEFDYSPYDCFANTVEISPGRFQIKGFEDKLPMVYALRAIKENNP